MTDYADDGGGLILDGPFDPDAQATVTDYIDYTEYLPADLIRSLTLIRGLDKRYLDSAQTIHELTRTYGQLPDLPPDARPDPPCLRKEISAQLDQAINAREASYAEACRLYDVIDRHFDRLDSIRQKLHALPKPPSRETSAAPDLSDNKRVRTAKKETATSSVQTTTPRITLRLDGRRSATAAPPQKSSRSRRSVIVAEHLAGLHPDSPIDSTEHSDAEGDPKLRSSDSVQQPTAPTPKSSANRKDNTTARRPRVSGGGGGTGAGGGSGPSRQRSVVGITTSNALALLKPPPEDAKAGSEDLPWLRLTDWEMTKLRKKMKKNAVWQPSEVMIHRELALRGRGWEAYRAAKSAAEAAGTEFVDCDDVMNTYVPGKLMRKTDATQDAMIPTETKLSNRGMKLNEAKKLKRENLAREQAAQAAAEAELATKRLSDVGSSMKTLFSTSADRPSTAGPAAASTTAPSTSKEKGKSSKKRKFEEVTVGEDQASAAPQQPESETASSLRSAAKRRKSGKDHLTTPANTSSVGETDLTKAASPRLSPVASKGLVVAGPAVFTSTLTPPPATRPSSQRRSQATSAEPTGMLTVTTTTSTPAPGAGGRDLRPRSMTPAWKAPGPGESSSRPPSVSGGGAPRRRKRPAPGIVQSGPGGGAAISHGRRKAKPTKKRFGLREMDSMTGNQDIRIDEDGVLEEIDPNEPRYCLCGDVSFGTMICCENQDCDKEWFHLDCVGLSEVPSRTTKWYCPDCRKVRKLRR
ncbi:hypothetical protein ASPZODRAFT_57011 [Penicilliopsis zonata CBS 506.65]|uniref:Chromatin modification-related protein n=1 Tax=Penicilliopsis zonata CBS 506.65 TaxID=1073090 RepID=A0A1L9SWY1_9EURO|nr:hypothetical protein ASPZODRAFT_57011 [Penicilliopsis zonata CBS 506.65]OJJ51669.1 hypothetical protein ASPZODRAFT_57011 [Penicilliopsis zonata CBS 506.65]